MNSCFKHCYY
uniref:Uncharacterized protein n=1 Tax=Lotus japonicus TaxID=34305 RepID=I3SH68_LOTJA|nr:unknown [Lotus japonicus]